MPLIKVKQLLDAGIHFGHRASRWNPKMRSYIYGKRQLIHIIDVRQTLRSIGRAQRFLSQVASKGSLILFVGTKRQAAETIEGEARRCAMPFVNQRWLEVRLRISEQSEVGYKDWKNWNLLKAPEPWIPIQKRCSLP